MKTGLLPEPANGRVTDAMGGLIFGLIRMRSSTFIDVRIDSAMQATDVSGIR